jgi:hypothetical protein
MGRPEPRPSGAVLSSHDITVRGRRQGRGTSPGAALPAQSRSAAQPPARSPSPAAGKGHPCPTAQCRDGPTKDVQAPRRPRVPSLTQRLKHRLVAVQDRQRLDHLRISRRPVPAPHAAPRRSRDRTQSSLANATNNSPTAGSSPERRSMSCQERIARSRTAAFRSPRPAAAWHSAAARANSAAAPQSAGRFRRLTPRAQPCRHHGPRPAVAARPRPPRQRAAAGTPRSWRWR